MSRLILSKHQSLYWTCRDCKRDNLVERRGCVEGTKAKSPIVTAKGLVKFDYCPVRWMNEPQTLEAWRQIKRVNTFRQHNALPVAGGFEDQDPAFHEALAIVEAEVSGYQEK